MPFAGEKRCGNCAKATENKVGNATVLFGVGYKGLNFINTNVPEDSQEASYIRDCESGKGVATDAEHDKCLYKREFVPKGGLLAIAVVSL